MKVRRIFGLLTIFVFIACTSNENLTNKRAERTESAIGDIKIAVVWNQPLGSTLYEEGVMLAVAEINARGGIFGRPIRMAIHSNVLQAKEHELARSIAKDLDVVAVIGHPASGTAIPVSLTYQAAGILFISTGATSPNLTNHAFSYVFRNIPSDTLTGKVLAEYCVAQGFRKMVVIDDESEYGNTLANIFEEHASMAGIAILLRRSYYPWQTDFSYLIKDIKDRGGDAIFLGGTVPQAAEVIKRAREMGVKIPFIGGDGLDQPTLWKVAGSAAEGTIVSTIFNPTDLDPKTQFFVRNFKARYGIAPDTWSALGYDAIYLLHDAFRRSQSTVPIVAASFLRFIEDRYSVMGNYSFTESGDIVGKKFFFKVVRGGKFEYINK